MELSCPKRPATPLMATGRNRTGPRLAMSRRMAPLPPLGTPPRLELSMPVGRRILTRSTTLRMAGLDMSSFKPCSTTRSTVSIPIISRTLTTLGSRTGDLRMVRPRTVRISWSRILPIPVPSVCWRCGSSRSIRRAQSRPATAGWRSTSTTAAPARSSAAVR